MNVFSLRARTLSGSWYSFTALDAPVQVGDDTFVLLGRKFSPTLQFSTIVAGSDVGVYVGDILEDADGEWVVSYERGFRAKHLITGKTKPLYEFDKLNVTRDATKEEWQRLKVRTAKPVFKYRDYYFNLASIIGKYRRDLVVLNVQERVKVLEVKQETRVTIKHRRIFLGDEFKGSPVVMYYGAICTQNEFGAYDILAKRYIIKED